MSVTAYELYNSRSFNIGKLTQEGKLEFVCCGTTDDAVAKAAINAASPATYPGIAGLVKGDVQIRPLGGRLWYATIPYRPDDAPLYPAVGITGPPNPVPVAPGINTPLGSDFSFDLSAQTEHITQSLATLDKIKRGVAVGPPADNKRAIGITADGEVKGCDRFKPYLEWSVSKTFNSISMQYIQDLSDLVGTTNNATFYGHSTGTQIFIGASGNTKDLNKCTVTFKFASAKHKTNITICDDLVVPSKPAWAYLWVAYKNKDDANQLTQQPVAAYVEKIYEEGNYAVIGIG